MAGKAEEGTQAAVVAQEDKVICMQFKHLQHPNVILNAANLIILCNKLEDLFAETPRTGENSTLHFVNAPVEDVAAGVLTVKCQNERTAEWCRQVCAHLGLDFIVVAETIVSIEKIKVVVSLPARRAREWEYIKAEFGKDNAIDVSTWSFAGYGMDAEKMKTATWIPVLIVMTVGAWEAVKAKDCKLFFNIWGKRTFRAWSTGARNNVMIGRNAV